MAESVCERPRSGLPMQLMLNGWLNSDFGYHTNGPLPSGGLLRTALFFSGSCTCGLQLDEALGQCFDAVTSAAIWAVSSRMRLRNMNQSLCW